MSLQTVINQNQETIAFLKARDCYSALVSSSSALQCLRSVSQTQQGQHEGDLLILPARNSSSSPEDALDQCMLHTIIQENEETCGTQTFMYSHAIQLPPNGNDYATVTLVLIFNAALAHHLVAMQDKENSSQYLRRAKQLYTLAYNSSQDIEQNQLFLFVVYNNTALANLQIGEDKDSWNACVEHLVSVYMVLVGEGYTSRLRHLEGFLGSLVVSNMPTAAAA